MAMPGHDEKTTQPFTLNNQPAFLARAGARAGFAAFFGSSLAARLLAPVPEPAIGSSISRWPSARFFLPLAGAGACFSLARLFFSASIRLMTLPLDFGVALG